MTAQPYVTAEHPSLDSPPESPLSAAAWRPIPERSAHEWIDRTARNLLPRPGTVVALDHGTGHWITSLMPLGHEVLAADSSQERLNTLAQRAGYALSHDPRAAFRQFAAGAGGPQAVLVHAELDALHDLIQSSGLKADAVCVNAIGASFPSPEIIFDTCMPWLKDGGLLLYVGNVFVREKDFEWSTISRTIANHHGIPHQQLFDHGSLFDLIALHREGPIRSREYGHHLGMFAGRLSSGAWKLADVDMMEAEGLQHVAPDIGDSEGARNFIFPAATLQLKKIGLVARKKSP